MHHYQSKAALLAKTSAFSIFMTACASGGQPPTDTNNDTSVLPQVAPLSATPPAALTKYSMAIEKRTASDLSQRSQQVAAVLLGTTVAPDAFRNALSTANMGGEPLHLGVDVGAASLSVHYEPSFDSLRVRNETADANGDSVGKDVGEGAASDIARSAINALIGAGTISSTGLDLSAITVRRQVHGIGQAGQPPVETVKAYVINASRVLGGAKIRAGNQEAGVRISVHRGGQILSIAVSGPTQISPSGTLTPIAGTDTASLVASQYAGSDIQPLGLEYVLDAADPMGAIVPRQTYFVVPVATIDGRTIRGRGQFVSYTLHEKVPSLSAWPIPDPGAKGNPR
jgi:hypothetical protein